MKRDTLIKVAITFGDTRNILNKAKSIGVSIERKPSKFGFFNRKLSGSYYPGTNHIVIAKNKFSKESPRNILAHEVGHAIHRDKKKNINNKNFSESY